MSAIAIRAALETAIVAMTPAIATAWENYPFTPPPTASPYQAVFLRFARPENPEMGPGYTEQGYMQINLMYPLGAAVSGSAGAAASTVRAELIRSTFRKNRTFSHSGVNVTINRTAEIGNGFPEGDRWNLPVTVRFYANVYN